MPPGVPNATLATFSKLVENDIDKMIKSTNRKIKHNIGILERKALNELKENTDIIIKSADKGGGIVVQNTKDYVTEAMRQLNNSNFYEQLQHNPMDKFMSEQDRILKNAMENNWITKNQFEFLKNEHPVTPVFYLLPKIHKSLKNPPGRPIVASKDSLTEHMSQFVDYFIKEIVTSLPSYVADTRDVLKLLCDIHVPERNAFLVTFDVESLYTNIPHEGGLQAMDYYLMSKKDTLPAELLMELTKFILKSNYFMFNNRYYLQSQGTSMGSPFAPNYANLYMGLWEHQHIFNNNPFANNIRVFKRYIDDIFAIFVGSIDELLKFNDYINGTYPSLKFTMEHDCEKIHFLDLLITVNNENRLETSIYRKPTDRNTILHASSFHPNHTVKNIPYGQLVRLRRICSNDNDFVVKANEMSRRFKQRGYDETLINKAVEKAQDRDRMALLYPTPKTTNGRITFVSEYSTASKQVTHIIKKHWKVLHCDSSLHHLTSSPPRFCFKRGKNIRDMVVSSTYMEPRKTTWLTRGLHGNYRCGKCAYCAHTLDTKTFTHPHSGKKYNIKQFINCQSTHVVYMLKCPCGLLYIGQTKRNLKLRFAEHKGAIRNGNMDYAIARHYKVMNHGSATSLKFIGLERVQPNPRGGNLIKQLLQREAYWINELNTVEPHGLNELQDLSVFL
ncbi:hypothetical protein ACEWY4_024380 [Coilia grayii]|uniref:Reverse transcriptase domain-containing protein n=1 Tax=Coilia grayii TaxID=363190 RepID=A0ABD1J095_9TELE